MWNLLKDIWLLLGRLFPFPTKPGLRRIGNPTRSSPVLVTCNFELTVREVEATLRKDVVDAWLLVAPTKGVNVWCAGGAGDFTTDTVISIIKTSGIEHLVNHRRIILPLLAANGVNIWDLRDRTEWRPKFGPAHIKDLKAFLEANKPHPKREHRLVQFELKDRFVMGTNLGFNVSLLLILPLLAASYWLPGFWWRNVLLLFVLSVAATVLVFWLPGKVGVQKGLSLGLLAAAAFVVAAQDFGGIAAWPLVLWVGWILVVSTFVGYDMPSWSPLWRQDVKELVLGVKNTHVEVIPEKCISCHMCDIVCPMGVFGRNAETKKYEVVNLDACEACGACIENCPTDAIVNNFREGVCSCPTCFIIDGVSKLGNKQETRSPADFKAIDVAENTCNAGHCDCDDATE